MKIYTQPKVKLIARPSINQGGIDEFLQAEDLGHWIQEDRPAPSQGDSLPEFCGRMCYVSFGDKQGRRTNSDYISNIIDMGHGSVLEHSNWTFLVSQASRGFTHEMVRHRMGFAYSQESTHYIDYSDHRNWNICLHPGLSKIDQVALSVAAEQAFFSYAEVYRSLRDQGIKKKDACSIARQILPNGMESKLCFTANARAIRHFLEYRGHTGNVLEIRLVALEVLKIMKQEAPNIFSDIETKINEDGYGEIISQHRKV